MHGLLSTAYMTNSPSLAEMQSFKENLSPLHWQVACQAAILQSILARHYKVEGYADVTILAQFALVGFDIRIVMRIRWVANISRFFVGC